MKAKRSVAILAVSGIVVVSVVAGLDLFSSPGSDAASDPVSGRAELAVLNSEKAKAAKAPSAKPQTAEEQALEVNRLRNQIEAVEAERKAAQDQSDLRQKAKNAALARYKAAAEDRQELPRGARQPRRRAEEDLRYAEGDRDEPARRTTAGRRASSAAWRSCGTRSPAGRSARTTPSSSAYGIPQALPGNRMAAYGADWRTNPVVQIKWGLDYIENTYGSPCSAWGHSQAKGWY